uniref:T9SS type B sorting domain-containing protein n=1 Tax=Capnocytophaga granulosa TaxID=45242 RepID=UPI0028E3AACB
SDFDITGTPDVWWRTTFPTLTFKLRITDQATGCYLDLTASGDDLKNFINSRHKAHYDIDINSAGTGAEACDNTQQNYMLKITLSDLNASGATVAQPTDYEYSIDGGVTYTTFPNTPGGTPGSYVVEMPVPVFFDHTKVKVRSKLSACESTLITAPASLPGTNQRFTYPKLAFTATKTQDVACDSGGNYTAKFKAVITNGTGQEFLPSSILPPAVIGGGNRYDIKVTYRTTNTQENRQASPFTAPTGSTPIGSTPVDTNVTEQDISVAPTPAPGGTELYYTVWIKDKGNKYCTDYIPSAPMKVLPAETPADLKARHKVEGADVEQQNACTGTTGTKGAFEFTRNTTPASPAIAREDVRFEYDLQKAPIGTTAFASTGTTITDANIIPNRSTDPLGTVRYRVEGLDEGDYKLIVKKSSNGECNGYDVTNIAGNVVTINKNPKVDFEMTTSSPPKPKIELVQMACAATTSPIFGLTPAQDKAQLKFKVKGGVPPYTAEVYIKDVRTSEFLFSREEIPSTVTALPYPALTVHEAEYAFDLPDRGIKYEVTLKIRDAKGCELDGGSGYAFHDEVLPFHKIESVTTKRTQRMSCDAATGQEIVELTINYSDPNGNGDGYNVQVDKLGTGGSYTSVGAYAAGERTVADIPGSGVGNIILPYVADQIAEYRIILFNKKTKCTYQLPTHYRMVKSEKPRVNFILKEGGCGDQGTTPAPTTIDLTFELQVEGGDFEANGYNYVITNPLGYNSGSLFSKLAKETKTLQVPITQAPANAVTQFQVDLRVVDSKCDATATTQVTRPAQIDATSAITHAMTYCGGQSNNDGVIAVTVPATGGWGGPYQYQIVSNGVEGGWTDELTFSGLGEGSHYVQVRDSKGCLRDLATFTFLQFNSTTMGLTVPAATVPEVPSCQGAQDGTIKLAGVTGGTGGTPIEGKLSYELFDAETELSLGRILPDDDTTTPVRGTVTFDNVGAGTYFIRVYSDMLCAEDHKDTPFIKVGDPGSIIARAYLSKYPGCNQEGSVTVEIDKRPEMRPSRKDYKVELYDVTDEANPQRVGGTPILKSGTDGITGVTYEFATGVKHGHNGGDVERKYQVKIWDNNGSSTPPPAPCEGSSNKVYVDKISELDGEVVAEESELNLKCFGSSYGKITVKATGGKADEGYNFKLLKGGSLVPTGAGGTSSANPNTQGIFEGLAKGDYQVEITQTNGGCSARVIPVTITEETKYVVKYKLEDVKCNGDKNGKITITHTEGFQHNNGVNRKLTYAISPRLDRFLDKPNGVIDSLAPGKYFVIVQDENGCRPNEIYLEDQNGTLSRINEDIIEFTIGEPEPLSVSVNPEYTEHESCVDAKDGKTRLRVFGGTPFARTSNDNEYELVIDGKAPIRYHTRDNGDLIGNLTAGEHTFRIIDKNGCEAETAVTIDPGSEVKLKLSAGKYECVDGKIKWIVEASVTPTTAALNVRYLLTEVGNPAKVDQPHDNTQFNLDVDLQGNTTKTYIISVLHKVAGHGECRVDSDPIQVAPKEPLTIEPLSGKPTVSCHDGEDGRFEITARGGSSKYNYGLKKADGTFDWQGDNNKFTGLKVGSYTVGVKDMEYNCIAELTNIVVESPDKIAIKQQSIQHVGCKGETNGKISYAIEGGNTPYKWEVYKEDGTTTSKRGTGVRVAVPFEITDLAAGKYMIKVTDAKDCEASKEFEIIEGVDLGGRIVQSYDCHASIDENNKVLVVAGGRGANSDTAAEGTYDVYVSVNTPYLVVNPSARGAANRLRYAIGVEGGTTPIQRYEFEGTTPEGSDNTHNMYQINHASLIPKLNAARALQEGLNQYKIYLYYFDKDNPAISDAPLCESVRDLNIEYYPPVKITNTSISNDLNLLKVKVEGGKERYTVYFCSAQYHTAEEAKSHYVQKVEDVKAGDEVTYFVQKTDYEEENPDTGKVEKKIRVYVEDSKGELKEENGGKEACGHSVFLYKEFVDVVIPNYFTPNGDGQYDTWAPLNLASYPNAETVIYDRYGRKIATLNNKEEWDGTYGGEALPTGDYWFILRLNEPDDNRTFKGHFTLYR